MPELNIENAVKPRYGSSTVYDLSYALDITPIFRATPMPCGTQSDVDLLSSQLVAVNGSTYTTGNFYTDWVTGNATFSIANPANARSTWYLKCGNIDYMTSTYGLLPSSYVNYEFISVNQLRCFGNWRRFLLYDISNGKYEAVGSALVLANNGGKSIISYDVTLVNPNTGDTVTVTGSSNNYNMSNSPTTTTMCVYQAYDTFSSNGDMKGQIRMTETPE